MASPMLYLADPTTPLFYTPPVIGAAVLVSDDPLPPIVATTQAADEALFAIIIDLREPEGESNPALPAGNPSGRSRGQYSF